MDFEVILYKNNFGKCPVEEFMLSLVRTNKVLFNKTTKGIEKLRHRIYHKEPLSKYIEPGLCELRIKSGNDILRIIYTFNKGRIIILLHVFVKKQQKMPVSELEIARKRLVEIKRIMS